MGDESDAATRALIEMMDGTLEAKNGQNDNGTKKLENYEHRLKENAKAIEEHRKAMELEMTKLKGEIKELTQTLMKRFKRYLPIDLRYKKQLLCMNSSLLSS